MDHHKGCEAHDLTNDGGAASQKASKLRKMGSQEKRAAIDAELDRVNQLPSNSSYAVHRLKVLNKLLQLMSITRTTSQEEELELLFAGLSL